MWPCHERHPRVTTHSAATASCATLIVSLNDRQIPRLAVKCCTVLRSEGADYNGYPAVQVEEAGAVVADSRGLLVETRSGPAAGPARIPPTMCTSGRSRARDHPPQV